MSDDVIDQREGGRGISEALPSSETDRSPRAAAERVRAFLDWDDPDAGPGFVGPTLYYGDLRALTDAVLK